MVYSIEQLKELVAPVAKKYNLKAVYVFGSVARGDATEESDIDFMVDLAGSTVRGWIIGGLFQDMREAIDKTIDIVTVDSVESKYTRERTPGFVENINREKVKLYG
jgi:predicted nucleotidyltransferase